MLSSLEDRTRLAEIEAQIRDLERSLVELRAEKTLVQERLRSSTYPVLTLPNEIWREVALVTPELWRAISFAYDGMPLEEQIHICEIWLSRSLGYPLSIRIYQHLGGLDKILSALVPHQARWEDLTLHIGVRSKLPNSLDGPMPLLRFLDVELSNRRSVEFHEAPLLRTACLTGTAASRVTLPWSQLTSLTLRDVHLFSCTSVLGKMTNLVHCRLDLSGTSGNQPDIVLPSLESLTIVQHGDLTNFIVPALRSLEAPERFLGPNPIRSLQSFILKSGCRLQEVYLTGERTNNYDPSDVEENSDPKQCHRVNGLRS
ncbi:hypothetical protein B0H13DRAFT_1869508 [Mycena leptocephala]|nr:hypothetical protein B0H13DRAFT_1869508 [Mycena leptocephala]